MHFNTKVQAALRHVHELFPAVTQVFFGAGGRWLFCDEDLNAPSFKEAPGTVDIGLLEDAAAAADDDKGFPCAYGLLSLSDYYSWWDKLSDVPVSGGSDNVAAATLKKAFLHFPAGTHRQEIWRWFEDQHPGFLVEEVLQGIRRTDGAALPHSTS